MPPHLKILSDLRKAKRNNKRSRRPQAPAAKVAAKGSPPVKRSDGVSTPHVTRLNKLRALIASPRPRNSDGQRQAVPDRKAVGRVRGK
jgi:hypothetical protein